MDSDHPDPPTYSNVAGPVAGPVGRGADTITDGIVDTLMKTRPWVLFMSIMVFLGCGLMVLMAIFVMIAGSLFGFGGGFGGPMAGIAMGLVYLAMAALYVAPGLHLMRFAAAIKRIDGVARAGAVEQALQHQRAFWRYVGILTIVVIGLYILLIPVAIIIGVMSSR